MKGRLSGHAKLSWCFILRNYLSHPKLHLSDQSAPINIDIKPSTSKQFMTDSLRLR